MQRASLFPRWSRFAANYSAAVAPSGNARTLKSSAMENTESGPEIRKTADARELSTWSRLNGRREREARLICVSPRIGEIEKGRCSAAVFSSPNCSFSVAAPLKNAAARKRKKGKESPPPTCVRTFVINAVVTVQGRPRARPLSHGQYTSGQV